MKKLLIALSVLFALTSCDILVQTPGQPPQIVGIEVTGAQDDLYELIGEIASASTVSGWIGADFGGADDDQVFMQVVDGSGSIVFDDPIALGLSDAFKLRKDNNWAIQIGIDGDGAEGGNFDFNGMGLGFTGATYILKMEVVKNLGGKQFATVELVEGTADDVAEANALTGAAADDGPVDTYINISEIRITNATAGQIYFLTGTDGALLNADDEAVTTGLDRYASNSVGGSGKQFAFGTDDNKEHDAADGTGDYDMIFTEELTTYDSTTFAESTIYKPVTYKLTAGEQIRIDLPYKDADGNVQEANDALTLDNTITGIQEQFSENPGYSYVLIWNATADTWSVEMGEFAGTTITGIHFGVDASMPDGVTYTNTTGGSANAARIEATVALSNYFGPDLEIKSNFQKYTTATGTTGIGDWDPDANGTASNDANGDLSWDFWFVPQAPGGDWGWGEVPTAGAFAIGLASDSSGFIVGSENDNFGITAAAGDAIDISIDILGL